MVRKRKVYNRETRKSEVFLPKKQYLKKKSKELNIFINKSEQWFNIKFQQSKIDLELIPNSPFAGFIPDYINRAYKLIIEVDGSIHNKKKVKLRDDLKDKTFINLGYNVIRIIAYNEESLNLGLNKIRLHIENVTHLNDDDLIKQYKLKK